MDTNQDIVEFNRSKIYEKLDYEPEPPNYQSKISWVCQQQISATNGIHYFDRVGHLKDYPVYELPVKPVNGHPLMLDIGCGWGRWLVAGADKGYMPIGIDIRLEFCKAARQVLKDMNRPGYTVVADLENIPFQNDLFGLVWSFSVIQHTHRDRLENCLRHINRILSPNGFTYLEFPNKNGLRNRLGPVKQFEKDKDDYNSWSVRYYTPQEYKQIFDAHLSSFSFDNHSFFGIGILKEDIKYVSPKNKVLCLISRTGSALTHVIPGLKNLSDSLYIRAEKKKTSGSNHHESSIQRFRQLHHADPNDNLNIHPLLHCPKYGGPITVSKDRKRAVAEQSGLYYPIENDIPILIASEARQIS